VWSNAFRQLGGVITRDLSSDLLTVERRVHGNLLSSPGVATLIRVRTVGSSGSTPALAPDITVAVRMDADNHAALDYYLLPRIDMAF